MGRSLRSHLWLLQKMVVAGQKQGRSRSSRWMVQPTKPEMEQAMGHNRHWRLRVRPTKLELGQMMGHSRHWRE